MRSLKAEMLLNPLRLLTVNVVSPENNHTSSQGPSFPQPKWTANRLAPVPLKLVLVTCLSGLSGLQIDVSIRALMTNALGTI
jgi:hypothetical protein